MKRTGALTLAGTGTLQPCASFVLPPHEEDLGDIRRQAMAEYDQMQGRQTDDGLPIQRAAKVAARALSLRQSAQVEAPLRQGGSPVHRDREPRQSASARQRARQRSRVALAEHAGTSPVSAPPSHEPPGTAGCGARRQEAGRGG
jgi:hypothetical protein